MMGGSSAVKSKGGRPPRLELIPKGKPSYTASELNTMNTKELVSLFTEVAHWPTAPSIPAPSVRHPRLASASGFGRHRCC